MEAKDKNIIVMNTPGGNTNATAEHTLALLLSLSRKISKADICILVNAFHHELENANVHKYVSNCEIVTHVLSPGAYFPEAGASNIYKNYKCF